MLPYESNRNYLYGLICVALSCTFRSFEPASAFRIAHRNLPSISTPLHDANWAISSDAYRNIKCLGLCDSNSLGGLSPEFEPNEITLANDQKDFVVDEELIYDTCQLYRSTLGFDDFSVDVIFVTSETMRDANRETFRKDRPTDIICHAGNSKYIKQEYHLNRSPMQVPEFRHLGEIMLCPEYINEQMMADAQMNKEGPEYNSEHTTDGVRGVAVRLREVRDLNVRFCYLLAHGFLHLLGYDHKTDSDFEEMLEHEDKLLDVFLSHYKARQQSC